MKKSLLPHIDKLIGKYKKDHHGSTPLYIVLSPDESRQAQDEIRIINKHPADYVITTYKEIKLAENPSLLNGSLYVSNELPETGS